MNKTFFSIMLFTLCSTAMAQINSKQFVECFVRAANEVIQEYRELGSKFQQKRICSELSQEYIGRLTEKFSEIDSGRIIYFSAESMAHERMIDIYEYIKEDMNCYVNAIEGQNDTLLGDIINSPTYHRNLNLTNAALDKMTGVNLRGHFFGKSQMYDTLDKLDFSYCK